jgi:uncharacterized membrane protein YcaP (DUF421 family)
MECPQVKLNDPFGRVSRRQQQTYAALCARLKQQGVNDIASVQTFVARVRTLAIGSVIGVIAVTLILSAVLPTLGGLIGVLGALALIWLATSYLQTRMYLRRYLNEECRDA